MEKHLKGKERRNLRSKYYNIKPTVWIGKNGISEGLINNIRDQLNSRRIIKIKFQKSLFDEDERKKEKIKQILAEILKKIGMKIEVIDIRGRTAILFKIK